MIQLLKLGERHPILVSAPGVRVEDQLSDVARQLILLIIVVARERHGNVEPLVFITEHIVISEKQVLCRLQYIVILSIYEHI